MKKKAHPLVLIEFEEKLTNLNWRSAGTGLTRIVGFVVEEDEEKYLLCTRMSNIPTQADETFQVVRKRIGMRVKKLK